VKRSKPLRADPSKVREFLQRGRGQLRRVPLEGRRKPLSRRPRRRKARIPSEVRKRVFARSGGRCVRPDCKNVAVHIHHVLDESNFPELAQAEANMVGTCPWCNWNHHFKPDGRLPRSCLPAVTLALAATDDRYELYLERVYA
jgi:5-methylcytosine-specific restriction endonuclease McrA